MFENFREESDELIHNKPHVLITIILIVVFFIIGLVVLLIQTSTKKEKIVQKIEFTADSPIMIPDTPNVEKDYYQYRTTPEKWSREELEKNFTFPDEKTMKQLEKENDNLVNDITGVAP